MAWGGTERRQVQWRTLLAVPAAAVAGLASAATVAASRGLNHDELWYSIWAGVATIVCIGLVWAAGRDDRRLAAAAATAGVSHGMGRNVAGVAAVVEFVLFMGGLIWLTREAQRYRLGAMRPGRFGPSGSGRAEVRGGGRGVDVPA